MRRGGYRLRRRRVRRGPRAFCARGCVRARPDACAGSSLGPLFSREVALGTHCPLAKRPVRHGAGRQDKEKCREPVSVDVARHGEGWRARPPAAQRPARAGARPGRHRLFDPARELTAEIFNVVRAEFPADRYAVLKAARPDLAAALFEAVETKAGELAVVSYDGRPVHLIGSVDHARLLEGRDQDRCRAHRCGCVDPKVEPRHLKMRGAVSATPI